jgi:hypothetical protein
MFFQMCMCLQLRYKASCTPSCRLKKDMYFSSPVQSDTGKLEMLHQQLMEYANRLTDMFFTLVRIREWMAAIWKLQAEIKRIHDSY